MEGAGALSAPGGRRVRTPKRRVESAEDGVGAGGQPALSRSTLADGVRVRLPFRMPLRVRFPMRVRVRVRVPLRVRFPMRVRVRMRMRTPRTDQAARPRSEGPSASIRQRRKPSMAIPERGDRRLGEPVNQPSRQEERRLELQGLRSSRPLTSSGNHGPCLGSERSDPHPSRASHFTCRSRALRP